MDSDAMETDIEVAVELYKPATLFLKSYHLGKSLDDYKGRRFLL